MGARPFLRGTVRTTGHTRPATVAKNFPCPQIYVVIGAIGGGSAVDSQDTTTPISDDASERWIPIPNNGDYSIEINTQQKTDDRGDNAHPTS
jgi:hypothetical protein